MSNSELLRDFKEKLKKKVVVRDSNLVRYCTSSKKFKNFLYLKDLINYEVQEIAEDTLGNFNLNSDLGLIKDKRDDFLDSVREIILDVVDVDEVDSYRIEETDRDLNYIDSDAHNFKRLLHHTHQVPLHFIKHHIVRNHLEFLITATIRTIKFNKI